MSRLQANFLLLLAAIIWGLGNIAHKTILDHLDAFSVVGLICLIGALVTAPLAVREKGWKAGRAEMASHVRLAALFIVAEVLQQIAYIDSSVTNASFLISTYTVITPLAVWLLFGERPSGCIMLAALMTLAGSYLLTGASSGAIGRGDMISIATAFAFAIWTIEIGRHMHLFGKPFTVASVQFAACAIVVLPFGWEFGNLSLAGVSAAWLDLVVLGLFSTALAYCLQTVAQQHTSASHAAIIVSSECVFAGIAAAALLNERISLEGAAGAAVVLAAVLIVAIGSREKQAAAHPEIVDLNATPWPASLRQPHVASMPTDVDANGYELRPVPDVAEEKRGMVSL